MEKQDEQPARPHSWDLEHWPVHVWPHTRYCARYMIRLHKLDLIATSTTRVALGECSVAPSGGRPRTADDMPATRAPALGRRFLGRAPCAGSNRGRALD